MHPVLIKAAPPCSLSALAIALKILLAFIVENVVLARDVKDIFGRGALEQLVYSVKLLWLGKMADVSSVQNEGRRHGQSIDLLYGGFESAHHIRIGRFVKAHVAVADLHKAEFASWGLAHLGNASQAPGFQHAAIHYTERSSAGPCHALKESAAVNPIVIMIV